MQLSDVLGFGKSRKSKKNTGLRSRFNGDIIIVTSACIALLVDDWS
jgi:hypothetical protein